MADDTMALLRDCALSVVKPNPRQYVGRIPQMPGVEVWFQRASDVVRKLRLGDVDLGIVGLDMLAELGDGDECVMLDSGQERIPTALCCSFHVSKQNNRDRTPTPKKTQLHSDLLIVHEALGFGHCHLALGVPASGRLAGVASLADLRALDCWTEETPLRVVTGACRCVFVVLGCACLLLAKLTNSLATPQATTLLPSASSSRRASSTLRC
jgi:ATP phosphoribosyltransferase